MPGHSSAQAWELGRTIDCFLPLAAYTEFYGIMRASTQGGGFWIRSSSILPSPAEMCGVFSNEKLLSNSGEEVQSGSDNSILFSEAIEPLPSPQIGKGFSHVQY